MTYCPPSTLAEFIELMPAKNPPPPPFQDGFFITSDVSTAAIAEVLSALVTARNQRQLEQHEESLCIEAAEEMRARLRETAAKRPNVSPNRITERPAPPVLTPRPDVPAIPKGWIRLRSGTADLPLRMTDQCWNGTKFVYVSNNQVQAAHRVAESDLIIREQVGGAHA